MATSSIVALIPARAGSKRIPHKNTKLLAGHPLIAYTIAAAKQSGIFGDIYVCTDSEEIIDLAAAHDTSAWQRAASADDEPDIVWVERVVRGLGGIDAFAILRPTSPFRTVETIKKAWWNFEAEAQNEDGDPCADSMRAVRRVAEHPAKMWSVVWPTMTPLLLQPKGTPWHSQPTQNLPPVYVQTAGLEIAWTETVRCSGTIAGTTILAYELKDWEALDLNTEQDWWVAERAIAEGVATLPTVT